MTKEEAMVIVRRFGANWNVTDVQSIGIKHMIYCRNKKSVEAQNFKFSAILLYNSKLDRVVNITIEQEV